MTFFDESMPALRESLLRSASHPLHCQRGGCLGFLTNGIAVPALKMLSFVA
jgi:hypothetical protein